MPKELICGDKLRLYTPSEVRFAFTVLGFGDNKFFRRKFSGCTFASNVFFVSDMGRLSYLSSIVNPSCPSSEKVLREGVRICYYSPIGSFSNLTGGF